MSGMIQSRLCSENRACCMCPLLMRDNRMRPSVQGLVQVQFVIFIGIGAAGDTGEATDPCHCGTDDPHRFAAVTASAFEMLLGHRFQPLSELGAICARVGFHMQIKILSERNQPETRVHWRHGTARERQCNTGICEHNTICRGGGYSSPQQFRHFRQTAEQAARVVGRP